MSGFGSIVIGSGLASSSPYAGTANNYSSLPAASTKDQQVWLVINSEGTRWLPGSLGGTYFPSGYYWSNGGVWDYIGEFPYQALQADVDAGVIPDQFVSPLTLNNYSRWATKKNDSMSTNRLLGRGTAGTGVIEEITLGTNLSLTGTTLNATGGSGTVTNVSSATADATITNPTTTPQITIVSAPKLTTARNINGVSFDGTGNITVADATKQPLDAGLTSISALTGAGYVKATATDTFSQVATIPQADVTNLTTDLAAKQATLVSGTNIRTVNGNTLLGSTDIVVSGTTNLSYTASPTNGIVVSDTGTDATIPLANGTNAGLSLNDYTTVEKTKLSGIAAGAEVNVNADWNSVSGDSQILNKPTIPTQYTDELAQDAVGAMVDTTLTYVDGTPLLQRSALTGAITASAGSNTTALGSFTTAQLNTALSDNDIATGGGTATGTNTGDQTSIVGISSTKAQFDTALSDGNFMYIGDAPTAHTHISTEITDFNAASRAQTEAELVAGTNITITPSGSGATRQLTIASTGGGGSSLTTQDEGVTLSAAVTTLNFTGAGVTASGAGATTTINIPGGSGSILSGSFLADFTNNAAGIYFLTKTVTDANVTPTSKPIITPYNAGSRDADELEMVDLKCSVISVGTGTFDVYISDGAMQAEGSYNFNYILI